MALNLHGLFVPLATPFNDDGEVAEHELCRLIRFMAPYVDGFVANGTTGDFPLLTSKEREQVVTTVVEEAGGDKTVIAGVGAIATDEAISLAQTAQQAGAVAVLVVKPYYVRPTSAGLRDHFSAVAEALPDLPILLYNFPKLMGQEIPVDVVAQLTEQHTNVLGMKDSSGQMAYTLSVLEAAPASFHVLVGHGALLLPAVGMGAAGAILAAANLVPQAYRAMYEAALENDWEKARSLQSRIYPVARAVSTYGSLAVRAGLDILGFDMGAPRLPLSMEGALSQNEMAQLQESVEDLQAP